jgi:hypothetical protein
MKNITIKNSKPGKRTHTLKEILEGQKATAQDLTVGCIKDQGSNSNETIPSLFEITEDFPFSDSCPIDNTKTIQLGAKTSPPLINTNPDVSEAICIFNELISKETTCAATHLEINELELKAWINLQVEVPAKTILNLLRTMQKMHLDPLNDEIGFTQYENGSWQVFITIEGCSKLLNQHSQFNGLVFNQADNLIEGIPEWIECSIYRRDRIMPITVREYYVEVRNEKDIWRKMPRRMLRHRALQQCVRLAIV